MQDNDSHPFINIDMECILQDLNMRCTHEVRWKPRGDEDEILRFYRFEGQSAAIILPDQPEDHRRDSWTWGNGKTGDQYTLVIRQVPDDLMQNFCENATDVILGIILRFYHGPHHPPKSDDSLL